MKNGISIYFGLDNSLEENIELIKKAHALGIRKIFTSLQIPETDDSRLKPELTTVLELTKSLNMEVVADVNAALLRDNPNLAALGIQRLRLDDGYNFHQISSLSRRFPICLNASTLDGIALNKLAKLEMDFDNTEAIFNFYPHPHTGQTAELVYERTKLLQAFGIKVSAFVPSQNRKRGPIYRGLPTIEAAREMPVSKAAFQLVAMGLDGVYIGDALPSSDELEVLVQLDNPGIIELPCNCLEDNLGLKDRVFTVRPDISPCLIRTMEARKVLGNKNILPQEAKAMARGSIVIDNEDYGRYNGELGICKTNLNADAKVNVIGQIDPDYNYLLDCLWPGTKFLLK